MPAERNRSGMRDVAEQGTERQHELDSERLCELDDLAANVCQRIDGSTPLSRIRSRGARAARASSSSTVGHSSWRRSSSSSLIVGRAVLVVVELLAVEPGEAPRGQRLREVLDGPRRRVTGVVPPAERAHQCRGAKVARTVIPEQGLHPGHGT